MKIKTSNLSKCTPVKTQHKSIITSRNGCSLIFSEANKV